jgi:hypothetical protein
VTPADPPNRLVFLLDHEYTPRGLGWQRLKGGDATRAPLLRKAAERAGCEAILALADIKTTYDAFAKDDEYGYGHDWYGASEEEDDDTDSEDEGEYEIQDFVDSEITITHWTGPDGTRLEETSLLVSDDEVCAAIPTESLTPYESEYEGYMGNWGNTLDRWYHRAAVIVWTREQAFANRAETSPAWAAGELADRLKAGDEAAARAGAATLSPFWDKVVRARAGDKAALLSTLLDTAVALGAPETAATLLRPFRVEDVDRAHAPALAKLVTAFGAEWAAELLGQWMPRQQPQQPWIYISTEDRSRWATGSLPGLCDGLRASGPAGQALARAVLGQAWSWLAQETSQWLSAGRPSQREQHLTELGGPLGPPPGSQTPHADPPGSANWRPTASRGCGPCSPSPGGSPATGR